MSEEDASLFGGVLPLDDVDSRAIDLAGRLAELIERLGTAVDALPCRTSRSRTGRGRSRAAVDALTATAERERWQRAQLAYELDAMVAESGRPGQGRRRERRSAARARRSAGPARRAAGGPPDPGQLPHRAPDGLHAGADALGAPPRRLPPRPRRRRLPAPGAADGDDLMLADPRIGERDPRSEDRQLLLDALMAATERLIVTYTGTTSAPTFPGRRRSRSPSCSTSSIRRHGSRRSGPRSRSYSSDPLHPFDPRNFAAGALSGEGPWSFDEVTLAGARALIGPRTQPAPFLDGPLPPRSAPVIELNDLVAFLEHPVRAFLRTRLGVSHARGKSLAGRTADRAGRAGTLGVGSECWMRASRDRRAHGVPRRSRAGCCRRGARRTGDHAGAIRSSTRSWPRLRRSRARPPAAAGRRPRAAG